jgi:molecular chaperone IbpA
MNTVFDFAPLSRAGIGFDHLFDLLAEATKLDNPDNYPPYNIEKAGDDSYRVTLALAGWQPGEIEITTQPNQLVVFGKKTEPENGEYLYRGLYGGVFERRFNMADYVKVAGARMENGLLIIDLVREVPEELKPRRIPIGAATRPKTIENQRAA